MSTLQDYITAVGNLVQGDYPPGEPAKILAIGQAVKSYSKHRPWIVVEDESGADNFDYAVSLLAHWSDGFSAIGKVEYPVDDTDEVADLLDEDAWAIYSKPAGDYLRFFEDLPAVGETFRVTYTAIHVCSDVECTVKAIDEQAVQALAAALYCEILATWFAQNQDSTIQADAVDHTSKSRDFCLEGKGVQEDLPRPYGTPGRRHDQGRRGRRGF